MLELYLGRVWDHRWELFSWPNDDTCEEEDLEAMTACRDMTGPGFCVDTGNTCYGGADAGIRTDCSAPNYDAVYRVVGIDPAADGCCHPLD